MRILLTGANGFIGAHLTASLLDAGHDVVGAVRSPEAYRRRFPRAEAIKVDMNADLSPDTWLPRLAGIDAVINCAGILQDQAGQSAVTIHALAPIALFDACVAGGVRRVIQISAISATRAAGTVYALTKLRADDHLRGLDLDWTVLRPSLVYAEGSYGGTSLLRALAAAPFAIPVVGRGDQPFQPLHVADLARTVLACLQSPHLAHLTLDPVGPKTLSLADIAVKLRAWMGLPPAPLLRVPRPLVALACRLGDMLQAGPLRTTSLRQIEHGNAGDPAPFIAAIGFTPRSMDAALAAAPAQAQDRWHARLFLMRPLLTGILALLWLVSGVLGLSLPHAEAERMVTAAGLPAALAMPVAGLTSLLDIALAVLLVSGRKRRLAGRLQLAVVAGYTLFLTIAQPVLWLDPYGPLLKNLPILALMLVWLAIAEDR